MATLLLSEETKRMVFETEIYPLLNSVYRFALRLTNDPTRAEDLVQETYLKAWRSLDGYATGTNARAWMLKICRNAFINDYRAKLRKPVSGEFDEVIAYQQDDEQESVRYRGLEEELGDQLYGDEVTKAIQTLKEPYREVFLYDLEGFTYDEIAKLLDVPIGTVRSRLFRARQTMADILRGYAQAQYGLGAKVEDAETNCPTETATSTNGNQDEVAQPVSNSLI